MAAARGALPSDVPTHRLVFTMVGLSLVALAPDLDVVAFALDIPYDAPCGHRGAGHSLVVAIMFGSLVGAAIKLPGCSRIRSAVVASVVAASHGLLDIFTDGGLGMALFWPLSRERIFAPWRPIPVAPIGTAFLSKRGLHILLTEALYFSPLLLYALWPRTMGRRTMAAIGRRSGGDDG
jgi:inner membrane protein